MYSCDSKSGMQMPMLRQPKLCAFRIACPQRQVLIFTCCVLLVMLDAACLCVCYGLCAHLFQTDQQRPSATCVVMLKVIVKVVSCCSSL